MGRKAKPTVLKLINGNPGKRKLNRDEPKFSLERMEAPPFLDAKARGEWDRVYTELHAQGMATSVDMAALAAYCVAYSRWIKAETKLQEMLDLSQDTITGGMAFKNKNGGMSMNPLIRVSNAAMDLMIKAASEFGMTPASRSRAGKGAPAAGGLTDPTAGNY